MAAPLWEHVEAAYQRWHEEGKPGWQRLGLTAASQAQTVWLDEPGNPLAELN